MLRERDITANLTKDYDDITAEYIKNLYTNIFEISHSTQEQIVFIPSLTTKKIEKVVANKLPFFPKNGMIVCQSVEGTNSTTACDMLFSRANIKYVKNFEDVFKLVAITNVIFEFCQLKIIFMVLLLTYMI